MATIQLYHTNLHNNYGQFHSCSNIVCCTCVCETMHACTSTIIQYHSYGLPWKSKPTPSRTIPRPGGLQKKLTYAYISSHMQKHESLNVRELHSIGTCSVCYGYWKSICSSVCIVCTFLYVFTVSSHMWSHVCNNCVIVQSRVIGKIYCFH